VSDVKRAHWLTRDVIAWDVDAGPQTTFTLHAAAVGGLEPHPYGVVGGDAVPLEHMGGTLPDDLAQAHPHLAACTALHVPGDVDVASLLRGQVAVSTTGGDRRHDATGLQLAGVIDDLYATDADLGVTWDGAIPSLAVWAPTARVVTLHLFDDPTAHPPGDTVAMRRDDHTGVWSVTGQPSWDRRFFLYEVEVYVPSTGAIEHNLVTDPYAVALATNSVKSQIVDLTAPDVQPDGWDTIGFTGPDTPAEAIIYELHVRDFSARDVTVPEHLRGTYRAFTVSDSEGMRHLARLACAGMSTVHLLPTSDIATIDDDRGTWQTPDPSPEARLEDWPPDSDVPQERVGAVADRDGYNWGYDPFHHTVPEGSYATEPSGPQRSLEYREMVQALHRTGVGVVVDVVYNHTAEAGQGARSVLDRIVPGYYHRLLTDGTIATSTCCPNTAPEHAMMGRLVVDSVVAWARLYKVDGFRFDLMGHHPRANMLAVRAALDRLTVAADGVDGRRILIYGEGWSFGEIAGDARFEQATQGNLAGTGIATFNDRLRDAVRGGGHDDADPRIQGFASGLMTDPNGDVSGTRDEQHRRLLHHADQIRAGLAGNLAAYEFIDRTGAVVTAADIDSNGSPTGYTAAPGEHVAYVSAHDNETLYDAHAFKLPTATPMADRSRMQHVALSIVAFAQGISFFHAGTDVLRSKSLDRNSYNSGDHFNQIDWSLGTNNFGVGLPPARDNASRWHHMRPLLGDPALIADSDVLRASHERFCDLLSVARSSPLFALRTAAQVKAKLRFANTGPDQIPGVIAMVLDDTAGAGVDPTLDRIVVVFNATPDEQLLTPTGTGHRPFQLSPVQHAGADDVVRGAAWDDGTFIVPARTTAVFVQPSAARA
jgi:pullulanase-type alpha-1,6-glucosidase